MSKAPRIIKDDELTLGQIFLLAFKKWITFKGRASRYQFWPFVLITGAMDKIIESSGISDLFLSEIQLGNFYHWLWFGPCFIFFVFVLIAKISLMVRRLHDVNMSGWLLVALATLSTLSAIFSEITIIVVILGIPAGVLGMILFFSIFFHGVEKTNKYGPDPKDGVEI